MPARRMQRARIALGLHKVTGRRGAKRSARYHMQPERKRKLFFLVFSQIKADDFWAINYELS